MLTRFCLISFSLVFFLFRLDFEEAEVFQICECVRYFLTNRQPLSNTEIRIGKRSAVTQIALKNFSWNIANPYNISGDATAAFVFNTFNEWFANTTIATIKKTLLIEQKLLGYLA